MAIEDLGLPRQIGVLRQLRLYHYRKALACTQTRADCEKELAKPDCLYSHRAALGRRIESLRKDWSEHIQFVQSLNDFFKVGDTAEGDLARETRGPRYSTECSVCGGGTNNPKGPCIGHYTRPDPVV